MRLKDDGTVRKQGEKSHRKNSVSMNLLISFGVLMLVGTIFFCILYFLATSAMKRNLLDQMDAQADFYLETIDRQFENTEMMLYNMFSDRKLVFLVNDTKLLDDYEMREALLAEQERIQMLKDSNPLISSVAIYLPNTGMLISDSAIREAEEEEFREVCEKYVSNDLNINYHEDTLYMASNGVPMYGYNEFPDILFVVEFSPEKIRDTLKQFNLIENGGAFFYQREQELFIDSIRDSAVSVGIKEELAKMGQGLKSVNEREKIEIRNFHADNQKYQAAVNFSNYLGYFVQYAPENEVLKNVSVYKWMMLVYLAGMAALAVLFSKNTNKRIHRPLNRLMKEFERAEKESLSTGGTKYRGNDEFSYLFDGFNHMQERTHTLVTEVMEQKELAQQAELRQLQSQINPHFLYNSLFMLRGKIRREELEDAERLTLLLGNYFQFLTRNGESNIPLADEVSHARNYVDIQSMRFRDRITIEFEELPQEYEAIRVPRLILQPVLENALKYGVEDLEEGGYLRVWFKKEGEFLEIHIEDNGQNFTEESLLALRANLERPEIVTGLVNIHRRLQLYYGEGAGLTVERSPLGGAEVTVKTGIVKK